MEGSEGEETRSSVLGIFAAFIESQCEIYIFRVIPKVVKD
jgi:hypothetical protein